LVTHDHKYLLGLIWFVKFFD